MAGDVIVIAVPLKRINDIPIEGLAGKIVLDTNNYMAWRDGAFDLVDRGRKLFTRFVKNTFQKRKSSRHLRTSRPHESPHGAGRPGHQIG